MTNLLKSDLYRFGKSKLLYGIAAFTGILAFSLMMTMRQDIRIGISVFGNLTAFKGVGDIIRIGTEYQKGLGILVAVLLSVFVGQEYQWKTWQHKWITNKSRTRVYLSKAVLSTITSAAIFLIFELIALVSSGQIVHILSGEYVAMIACGAAMYAALGAVICMLTMLIRNSTASTIICLGYVLISESIASLIKSISGLWNITANVGDWIVSHSIYGMSLQISSAVSLHSILPTLVNSAVIIILSAAIGLFFFRKYEL